MVIFHSYVSLPEGNHHSHSFIIFNPLFFFCGLYIWPITMKCQAQTHSIPGCAMLLDWRSTDGWMDGFHKQRWIHKHIMWLKVCHKPPMPGNGLYKFIHVYTTYRHGDDRGMVYSIFFLPHHGNMISTKWWPLWRFIGTSFHQQTCGFFVAFDQYTWDCFLFWLWVTHPVVKPDVL